MKADVRRRLKQVRPHDAAKILTRSRYWTVDFLEPYLERCDAVAFERPADGYRLAQHAPALAGLIQDYRDEIHRRSLRVRAGVVFASASFRAGEMTEARGQYQRVVAILDEGPVDMVDKVQYLLRFTNYRKSILGPGNPEPFRILEEVFGYIDELGAPILHATALLLRGSLFWHADKHHSAAADWAQAISLAQPIKREPKADRLVIGALCCLGRVLAENALGTADYHRTLSLITATKSRMKRGRMNAVKAKLLWVEATLNRRLFQLYGEDEHLTAAQSLLTRARDAFQSLQLPEEFVLASLELGFAFKISGQQQELRCLYEETEQCFAELSSDIVLMETLDAWGRSPRGGDLEQLLEAAARRLFSEARAA